MMTNFEAALILFFGSLLAGCLGALSGLGGGIIVVPLLVLGLGVDIHYAIGASLMAVIATSCGSSIGYVREGYANIRAGLFLETATTLGALGGATLGSRLPVRILFYIFGITLIYCAIYSLMSNGKDKPHVLSSRTSKFLKLEGTLAETKEIYYVEKAPLGWLTMFFAGMLSGVLGIGSGPLKVLALDKIMKFPFKVSTTTSNFMIGVTAATSAGVYLSLGYINPILCMPIIIGILAGAFSGSMLLPYIHTKFLRILFAALVLGIAIQMLFKGFIGVS